MAWGLGCAEAPTVAVGLWVQGTHLLLLQLLLLLLIRHPAAAAVATEDAMVSPPSRIGSTVPPCASVAVLVWTWPWWAAYVASKPRPPIPRHAYTTTSLAWVQLRPHFQVLL